jgi:hypothetical protein
MHSMMAAKHGQAQLDGRSPASARSGGRRMVAIDAARFRGLLSGLSNRWRLGPKPLVIVGDHPQHGAIMLIDDDGALFLAPAA